MMKRVMSLLLCLMLALPAAAQAKTFDHTIWQLMRRQLDSATSLRVAVTAEASGAAPAQMSEEDWQQLSQTLAGIVLNGTYFKNKSYTNQGDEQITLALQQGEDTLASMLITGKDGLWMLDSDLLPGKTLAISRDIQAAFMLLTRPQEDGWPGVVRMLLQLEEAEEGFDQQLDQALSPHMALLNAWLQEYTQVEMTPDENGGICLHQSISIPAEQVKAQIKELLSSLYRDEALLALLRAQVAQQVAHAYLEPGMLPLFNQVIDAAQLEGDVRIMRSYDAQGVLTGEEITLPFIAGMGLKQAGIVWQEKNGVRDFRLCVTKPDDMVVTFVCSRQEQAGAGTYQGEISAVSAGGENVFGALYTFTYALGMETYNEENASREREQHLTAMLQVQPKEENAFDTHTVRLDMTLQAGEDTKRPVYLDAVLGWENGSTGSQLQFAINAKTGTGLRISETGGGETVQLDQLGLQQIKTVLPDIIQQLTASVISLTGSILGEADAY